MKVYELKCDRCSKVIKDHGRTPDHGACRIVIDEFISVSYKPSTIPKEQDLCDSCLTAFHHFMNNEDQVGKSIFKLVDGPCDHYVPCAGPCTSVWTSVPR